MSAAVLERPVTTRWRAYRTRLGQDHLVGPGNVCLTCPAVHPAEGSEQDHSDYLAGTLALRDPAFLLAMELAEEGIMACA